MIVSQARIEANRRNAQKSTGPRTEEGKAASRANALKHGLCSAVVVAEDLQAVNSRAEQVFRGLKPQNEYQAWHVGRIAVMTLRVDRVERMERRIRDKVALRAELTWDDDRKLEAETLGGVLSKRPAHVVEALRRTPQGCDWMITRWAMLAHAAEHNPAKTWTPEQVALAFDLLSTPGWFRAHNKPGTEIDLDGREIDPGDDQAAIARRQVDELLQRRAVVAEIDEAERALAAADLDFDSEAEIRRLRRYEATLHRQIKWSVAEVAHSPADKRRMIYELRPGWVANPVVSPEPEPPTPEEVAAESHSPASPSPPFCLEPEEFPPPGQDADIPAILASRKRRRARKVEARQAEKRRKLEQLRA